MYKVSLKDEKYNEISLIFENWQAAQSFICTAIERSTKPLTALVDKIPEGFIAMDDNLAKTLE